MEIKHTYEVSQDGDFVGRIGHNDDEWIFFAHEDVFTLEMIGSIFDALVNLNNNRTPDGMRPLPHDGGTGDGSAPDWGLVEG